MFIFVTYETLQKCWCLSKFFLLLLLFCGGDNCAVKLNNYIFVKSSLNTLSFSKEQLENIKYETIYVEYVCVICSRMSTGVSILETSGWREKNVRIKTNEHL